MHTVKIFTDGSCTPKRSGWGVVVEKGRISTIYKGEKKGATNNEMELFAFKVALEKGLKLKESFSVFSDSQYVLNIFFKPQKTEKDSAIYESSNLGGWIKNWADIKTRKNGSLILEIKEIIQKLLLSKINFEINWVRGHHLTMGNHLADLCAKGEDDKIELSGYI